MTYETESLKFLHLMHFIVAFLHQNYWIWTYLIIDFLFTFRFKANSTFTINQYLTKKENMIQAKKKLDAYIKSGLKNKFKIILKN